MMLGSEFTTAFYCQLMVEVRLNQNTELKGAKKMHRAEKSAE